MARRSSARLRLALVLLSLAAVAAALLSSPRHRAFYSRLLPGASEAPPAVELATPAAVPSPAREPAAPRGTADRLRREPPGPAPAPSGPTGRVVVKVAETSPATLPSSELPPGWTLKEFVGQAQVEVVLDDRALAFRLVSQGTSFALYRDLVLDIKRFPILRWRWKVVTLPTSGDVRERPRDDQAAQVYLVFPRWPSPRSSSDVMGYIWDSHAPAGANLINPQSANVKVVVLQSGADQLNRWVEEERNVYQDYKDLFGREPPRVGKVALMVDSDDTQSRAEALFEELVFLRSSVRR